MERSQTISARVASPRFLIEREEKRSPYILPVLIGIHALALLAVLLFCDVKYEVSDDFVMELIASGAYTGTPDAHLMFCSVIWGKFLCVLYRLAGGVSWYFFTQIAVCFFACCAISYYLANTCSFSLSVLLTVAIAAFFAGDLYLLPQFTKSAAAAIASGGLLFLWGLFRGRGRMCVLAGAALVIAGCFLRHNAFYIVVPYLGIYFVFEMAHRKRAALRAAAAAAALVALIFVLRWVNLSSYYSDEDYRYYLDFSYVRAKIVDYPMPDYEVCAEELAAVDISENDYQLIREWCFADRSFYSLERMREVLRIVDSHRPESFSSWKDIVRRLIGRMIPVCPGIVCCLILTAFGALLNRRRIWIALCAGVATLLLMLHFLLAGHAVYRVEFGFFFAAAALLLWTLDPEGEAGVAEKLHSGACKTPRSWQDEELSDRERKVQGNWKEDRCGGRCRLLCGVLAAGIFAGRIGAYVPDQSYRALSDAEYRSYVGSTFDLSWDYVPEKYTKTVNRRTIRPAFLEEAAAHPENLYLLDFNTTIQSLYFDFSPYFCIPKGAFHNLIYLGGVTVNHPVIDQALAGWQEGPASAEREMEDAVEAPDAQSTASESAEAESVGAESAGTSAGGADAAQSASAAEAAGQSVSAAEAAGQSVAAVEAAGQNTAAAEAAGQDAVEALPLLLQDGVYFVSNGTSGEVLRYLQEHYDAGASVRLCKELDGYCIWKYSGS